MSPRNKLLLVASLLFFVSFPVQGAAGDGSKSMQREGSRNAPFLIRFYQDVISPTDGDRCSMSPSCSGYAADAIHDHGILMGWIMACDRLMRCGGDERSNGETVYLSGRRYIRDTVKTNDFWLTRKGEP